MKTVCPKGHMGSNPILSARHFEYRKNSSFWRSTQEVEETPLERVQVVNSGARVQIPPSPFGTDPYRKSVKNLFKKSFKKCLTPTRKDVNISSRVANMKVLQTLDFKPFEH